MFKKLMFAGILLISVSALKAKNVTPVKALLPNANDELVTKIAADNDFKNYYISNVKFANKVIETDAGSLFLKYTQKKITAEESNVLFAKMNVAGKEEFDAIAVNLRNEAVAFYTKFPGLKTMTEKEQKELLVNAFKRISTDKTITTKFVKARNVTPEQCFGWWMSCNTLCFIGCFNSQGNACYWECSGFCAVDYGVCWFIAS